MTTEGDGNYGLQKFLEAEGAECDIQPVTAWILFMIWEQTLGHAAAHGAARRGQGAQGPRGRRRPQEAGDAVGWPSTPSSGMFYGIGHIMGLHDVHLPDMDEVAEAAAPFYNNHLRGGEGHMEVGKLILNIAKAKATMTLSVKPFGCMPSAGVSDGVQSIITEKYPQGIFCAIETNGDGAVNVYSRVQMMLFKARLAAQGRVQGRAGEARPDGRGAARLPREASAGADRRCSIRATGRWPAWRRTWSQHVADDIKKTRTAKIIDFTKRVLARRSAKRRARGRRRESEPRARRRRTSRSRHAASADREAAGDRPPRDAGDRERRPGLEARRATWPAPSTICSASRFTARTPAAACPSARRRRRRRCRCRRRWSSTSTARTTGRRRRSRSCSTARDIVFTVLDVANDEAERSWVVTAAKTRRVPDRGHRRHARGRLPRAHRSWTSRAS